jgi:aspartyl-tRNA synthetase
LRRFESLAIFKIENAFISGAEQSLAQGGFMKVFTPTIIAGKPPPGCEGIRIDFHGEPAYLRSDPVLHKQLVIAGGFDRIYEIATNWYGGSSPDPGRLSEFRVISPEIGFIDDERDVMELEEKMVLHSIRTILAKCSEPLEILGVEIQEPEAPFPELSFPQACDLVDSPGISPSSGSLDSETLEVLGEHMKRSSGSDFFFLKHLPSTKEQFYAMRLGGDVDLTRSWNLICKGVRVSLGGQREHRHPVLLQQIKDSGLDYEELRWYTDPFRYGMPPHGGFSLGVEGFISSLLDIADLKDATMFARRPHELRP